AVRAFRDALRCAPSGPCIYLPRMFTVLPAFRLTLCATGVALLALPLSSRSQTAPTATPANETTLNTMTVVGNWLEAPSEEKVLEHPGARTIVDRKAVVETGANNVRDVLKRVPGVQVQDNNG